MTRGLSNRKAELLQTINNYSNSSDLVFSLCLSYKNPEIYSTCLSTFFFLAIQSGISGIAMKHYKALYITVAPSMGPLLLRSQPSATGM